jgi:hypothetical protein
MIRDILQPPKTQSTEAIHRLDAHSLWFGVLQRSEDRFIYEGPRYGDLMLGNASLQHWEVFPSLVSFVGDTGRDFRARHQYLSLILLSF